MKRAVMIAVALGVAVPAGFAAGRLTATQAPPAAAPGARPGNPGPVESAVEAVISDAADHRSSDPATADRALLARSTVEDGPVLVNRRREQEANVAAAWPGGPTRWWVAPLATRTLARTAETATVDVWFAEVIAPPGVTPMGDWRVTTVTLRREGGRWRVAGLADRLGPVLRTRSSAPTTPEGLASFVEGFEAADHA